MAVDLDDPDLISRIDSSNMLGAIDRFPDALLGRPEIITQRKIVRSRFSNLCLMGMGGSASAGDLVLDWLNPKLKVASFVLRDSQIPASVNSKTLFMAISYSGNTVETLKAFRSAINRRASVIGIGTGGNLRDLCARFDAPFIKVEESVAPRAALPQLVVGVATMLDFLSLVPPAQRDFVKASRELLRLRPYLISRVSSKANPAKKIADQLFGRFPVIYSLQRMSSVARRFKNQLAENSKQGARFDLLPEACHNEIEAWSSSDRTSLPVLIRDKETQFEQSIVQAFKSTISKAGKTRPMDVSVEGSSSLSRLLSPMMLLDYASVYLAILKRIDPTRTRLIAAYKRKYRGG